MLAWTRYFAEVQALFVGTGMAVALTSRRRVAHRAICIAAMVLAAEVSVLSAQSTADSAEAEQVTIVGQAIDTTEPPSIEESNKQKTGRLIRTHL